MENILEVKNLTKIYPGGVLANYELNFAVKEGEIHALVGENGAGKSTLMKMLYGLETVTSGDIYFRGEKVHFTSPKDAIARGIGMVHQNLMLVESLTVAQNLTLGMEPVKGVFIDSKRCIEDARRIAKECNFQMDFEKKVMDISIGMKQKLEIMKVLYRGAKVIILDEPTAVLTPQETDELFNQLIGLKKNGYTIIFISHKLDEVVKLSDRITVLKSGRSIGTYNTNEVTQEEISNLMVGRDITIKSTPREFNPGRVVLKVNNISHKDKFGVIKLKNVSLSVREGEILGIAGIEGNGQSEIVDIIAGLKKADSGNVLVNDVDITNQSVSTIRKEKVAHVAEDRNKNGCAAKLSVLDNIISVDNNRFLDRFHIIKQKSALSYTEKAVQDFHVKTPSCHQQIGSLSGGNIQKAIVAREFMVDADVLLVNQPTRGIDVGSIELIHKKLNVMREKKKAILLVSADLTELLSLSDRILVFCKGEIVGEFTDIAHTTDKDLGLYMLGIKNDRNEVTEA